MVTSKGPSDHPGEWSETAPCERRTGSAPSCKARCTASSDGHTTIHSSLRKMMGVISINLKQSQKKIVDVWYFQERYSGCHLQTGEIWDDDGIVKRSNAARASLGGTVSFELCSGSSTTIEGETISSPTVRSGVWRGYINMDPLHTLQWFCHPKDVSKNAAHGFTCASFDQFDQPIVVIHVCCYPGSPAHCSAPLRPDLRWCQVQIVIPVGCFRKGFQ